MKLDKRIALIVNHIRSDINGARPDITITWNEKKGAHISVSLYTHHRQSYGEWVESFVGDTIEEALLKVEARYEPHEFRAT